MHNSSKNYFIVTSVAITLITCILRVFLMLFGFDYDSNFFNNDILATVLYLFVLLSAALIFYFSKKINTDKAININSNSVSTILYTVLNILSAVIFAILFYSVYTAEFPQMSLGRITHWIAVISSAFSIVYFILVIFYKKVNSSIVASLNIAPVIYLLCLSVDCFTSFSTKANSYYLFPHVISLIILAFYILNKARIYFGFNEGNKSILPHSLVSLFILSFSFIPDIILLFSERMEFSQINISITAFKGIYIIISVMDTYLYTKAKKEDK